MPTTSASCTQRRRVSWTRSVDRVSARNATRAKYDRDDQELADVAVPLGRPVTRIACGLRPFTARARSRCLS